MPFTKFKKTGKCKIVAKFKYLRMAVTDQYYVHGEIEGGLNYRRLGTI
jgi:hypothetical protein